MLRTMMRQFVGITASVLACLAVAASPALAGVEATTELLFETLARVEARFRSYRATSGDLANQLKRAEAAEAEARARAKAARLAGDRRTYEEAQAEATDALVSQILVQEERVIRALEAFEHNRRDLARILPRLRSKAGGTGPPERDRAQEQRLLMVFRDMGADVRNLARFFDALEGVSADPHAQVKIASTTASLLAIQHAIERGQRSAEVGPGGFGQAALAVANALETINGTLPLLVLRRDFLLDQKEKVRVANALVLIRLASAEIFHNNSLNPVEITNVVKDEIGRDLERDRRADELLESEAIGPSGPSRREVGRELDSLNF